MGRSAWRLIHTMADKFPTHPTKEEQDKLIDFIYLFAQLYPCGDCASHFSFILSSNPPNATSRESISQWACQVHNLVNERLDKEQFDCRKVSEMWKCGCTEDELDNSTSSRSFT